MPGRDFILGNLVCKGCTAQFSLIQHLKLIQTPLFEVIAALRVIYVLMLLEPYNRCIETQCATFPLQTGSAFKLVSNSMNLFVYGLQERTRGLQGTHTQCWHPRGMHVF